MYFEAAKVKIKAIYYDSGSGVSSGSGYCSGIDFFSGPGIISGGMEGVSGV